MTLLDTLPSSALSGDMPEYVYFYETADNYVYNGWSANMAKRHQQHLNEGMSFLAGLPGSGGSTNTDEQRIQEYFAAKLVPGRGKSTFEGSEIVDYVIWLLANDYATADYELLPSRSRLPFAAWHPSQVIDVFEEPTGQLLLGGCLRRPSERIAYASKLVHLSSESDEWYTPREVIDRARLALGGQIHTDPASCAKANEIVNASFWYSKEVDGLSPRHPWRGSVWLNPPYGRGESRASCFVNRLVDELDRRRVSAAITCLNLNSGSTNWFDVVWRHATVHLIWRGRVNFLKNGQENENSSSKGTILSYFGTEPDKFKSAFAGCGTFVTA